MGNKYELKMSKNNVTHKSTSQNIYVLICRKLYVKIQHLVQLTLIYTTQQSQKKFARFDISSYFCNAKLKKAFGHKVVHFF